MSCLHFLQTCSPRIRSFTSKYTRMLKAISGGRKLRKSLQKCFSWWRHWRVYSETMQPVVSLNSSLSSAERSTSTHHQYFIRPIVSVNNDHKTCRLQSLSALTLARQLTLILHSLLTVWVTSLVARLCYRATELLTYSIINLDPTHFSLSES